MKVKLVRRVLRTAARHPRATLWLVAFVARHRRGTWRTIRSGRAVMSSTCEVAGVVSDPALGRSVGAAAGSFGAALTRARRIGPEKAVTDKRVARHVAAGAHHVAEVAKVVKPKPKGRLVRTLGLTGLVAVACLTAWEGSRHADLLGMGTRKT